MKLLFDNSRLRSPKGTNRIYVVRGRTVYYRHFDLERMEKITIAGQIDFSVPLLTKQVE